MKINALTESFASDELKIESTFDNGDKIKCVVYLPVYYISLKGVNAPPRPILKTDHNGDAAPNNMVKACRVQNITAEPKRMGLGSYLVWRAAKRAKASGVNHLLAMKVNPTTNNWYKRMGFTEYDSSVTLFGIQTQEKTIREQININAGTGDPEKDAIFEALVPVLQKIMEEKADMIRFAKVNDVIQNAKADWEGRWAAEGVGWKPKEG